MNPIKTWLGRLGARFKALTSIRFPSSPQWPWAWPFRRGGIDYSVVGNGSGNSAVMACVSWITRTFPEAPLQVLRRDTEGEWAAVDDHALTQVLEQPNPYYSGPLLWMATLTDWVLDGNAYWLKLRTGSGKVTELWYVPAALIEPAWPRDGAEFISHYEYKPDGSTPVRLERDDVVHFRNGVDPDNLRKGRSPIRTVLGEIYTDQEAARYSATLLTRMGVPGIIVSPKEKDGEITPDEAVALKINLTQKTTGDHRGDALVVQGPVDVHRLSFNPQEMNTSALSDRAEERISAVLGIPAAVVGLGTGLEQTKVGATMAELREQAYESCIIPTQRLLTAELNTQLLPDFGDARRERVGFDNSQVRVLQDDQDKLYARLDRGVQTGWLKVADARRGVGEPVTPADEIYLRPSTVVAVLDGPQSLRQVASLERPALKVLTKADEPAADELLAAMDALREQLAPAMLAAVVTFLTAQAERVAARLSAQATMLTLLPQTETELLRATLEPWYRAVLDGLHAPTQATLGVAWGIEDPQVLQYLREAGAQITGIDATTREAVARVLQAGRAAGLTPAEIGRQLQADFAFSRARAETIQRTELAQAMNQSALTHYRASGVVVGVVVFDGDFDPVCAAMNGRRFPLGEAGSIPRIAHPNCVRAFGPLTTAEQLQVAV